MTYKYSWDAENQKIKKERLIVNPPKKLSKVGEWMRNNPDGIIKILDMRAVLK
jgi:hypothetical protein